MPERDLPLAENPALFRNRRLIEHFNICVSPLIPRFEESAGESERFLRPAQIVPAPGRGEPEKKRMEAVSLRI
jgi:hypothetical protein